MQIEYYDLIRIAGRADTEHNEVDAKVAEFEERGFERMDDNYLPMPPNKGEDGYVIYWVNLERRKT